MRYAIRWFKCKLKPPKKKDSLKYHEVLHPNMIKTSSRKEIIRRAVIDKYLDLDAYKLRRKTGY